MPVTERAHLSIGEVLSLLQDEFPDVTISKIRFLESQGLLDPERTPSGYRKFYDADILRLRWILRQQRENFLPLKVIKGRLSPAEGGEDVEVRVRRVNGRRWREVDVFPNKSGRFSFEQRIRRSTMFVGQWEGDPNSNGDGSGPLIVKVG